jgi:hypothetical protein
MRTQRSWIAVGVGVLMGFTLAGCNRVPSEYRATDERLEDSLNDAKKEIDLSEAGLKTRIQGSADVARLAKLAKFDDDFAAARQKVTAARELYNSKFRAAMKLQEPARGNEVEAASNGIAGLLDEADDLRVRPGRRAQLLLTLRSDRDATNRDLLRRAEALRASVAALEAKVPASQARHTNKKADLERRTQELQKEAATATTESTAFVAEKDNVVAALQLDKAEEAMTEATDDSRDLASRLDQLDREYSKVLSDMRADMTVTIGRSSWQESSEYGRDTDYTFAPVVITAKQFASLVDSPNKLDSGTISSIGLDPLENMGADDSAEYWVENVDTKLFHKYTIIENKATTAMDWQEVDAVKFDRHLDDLGMTIVNKPLGQYEDEADTNATPPGWQYVGNPAYGSWQQNAEGRYWAWGPGYGYYGGFYPGMWIWFVDWNDWNRSARGRRSWYGRPDRDRAYGTGSAYGARMYGGSTWATSGGYRRQDPALRGLAQYWRGGGPGGGGK